MIKILFCEIDSTKQRRTIRFAQALIAVGVAFSLLLVTYYVLPYQRATGVPAVGEYLLAVGVGLSLVTTGAWAWWGAAHSYRERPGQ